MSSNLLWLTALPLPIERGLNFWSDGAHVVNGGAQSLLGLATRASVATSVYMHMKSDSNYRSALWPWA
jgi:hypothetical protein